MRESDERARDAVMRPRSPHPLSVIPPRLLSEPALAPTETVELLAQWMTASKSTRTSSPPEHTIGFRFACYGRTSTTRHQDRVSSQGWQRDIAEHLISDHGQIVTAYFDAGTSRRTPWSQRPQAAQLLTSIAASEPAVDAIVVGEYERAFTGTQFATLYIRCTRHGIQLWLPETGGPVDLCNRALLALLATQSQREVVRTRHRRRRSC
jgi:hypothetical protein